MEQIKAYRKKYKFINKSVAIKNEHGTFQKFPCIGLYEIETSIPVTYTGFEKYLVRLDLMGKPSETTYNNRATAVCKFLNYVLYETNLNTVHECSAETLLQYLEYAKEKEAGKTYTYATWKRNKKYLLDFLTNYYISNKETMPFRYTMEDLHEIVLLSDEKGYHPEVMQVTFNVDNPTELTKHRLNKLLLIAEEYDPEIALAIGLQAYAGLRAGEVVNLSCGGFKKIRTYFRMLSSIELDLRKDAPFFLYQRKKTNPGRITKKRVQKVYDDFVDKVAELHETHIKIMESKKYDMSAQAPLFVNYQGKPMSVQTYSGRLEKLFYTYFIPALKDECKYISERGYANKMTRSDLDFIEACEQKYPGTRMFRKWFVKYLEEDAGLPVFEVMKWKGAFD